MLSLTTESVEIIKESGVKVTGNPSPWAAPRASDRTLRLLRRCAERRGTENIYTTSYQALLDWSWVRDNWAIGYSTFKRHLADLRARGILRTGTEYSTDGGRVKGTWIVFLPEAVESPVPEYAGPLPF